MLVTRVKYEIEEKSPLKESSVTMVKQTTLKIKCIQSNGIVMILWEHRKGTLNLLFKKCINWAIHLEYIGGEII